MLVEILRTYISNQILLRRDILTQRTWNIDLKAINKYKKNNYEQPMIKKQNRGSQQTTQQQEQQQKYYSNSLKLAQQSEYNKQPLKQQQSISSVTQQSWLEQYTANQKQMQQQQLVQQQQQIQLQNTLNNFDILRTFDTQDSSTTTTTFNYKPMQISQNGNQKSLEDDINMLYYKYFSGRVNKSNQLSKQNELYIQHLLAQSQAYQQQKKFQSIISPSNAAGYNNLSNKENSNQQQQQQIFPNNLKQGGSLLNNGGIGRDSHSQQRTSQSRNDKNIKISINKNQNFSNNSNFSLAAKQLKNVRQGGLQPHPLRSSFQNKSLKQSQLNSTSELAPQSTFDSMKNGGNIRVAYKK
eukprot:403347241